jgi:phage tail-like protein
MASAQKPRPTNHFKLTLAGKEAMGQFREVSGLDSESEIVEHKEVDAQGNPLIVKVNGNLKWSNIELKRGVDINKGLWEWRYMVESKGPDAARTDCTLELIDYDGSAIATYNITQAWPVKYSGASMNAGSNEVAVEGITICHEGFKRM